MRNALLPIAIVGALSLSGCASYGLGGIGGGSDGYGSDYGYGYNGRDDFERALGNRPGEVDRQRARVAQPLRMVQRRLQHDRRGGSAKRADHVPVGVAGMAQEPVVAGGLQAYGLVEWMQGRLRHEGAHWAA